MPLVKHTGISSMSELFAQKKNIASQAKFDHRMSSMTKEFYSKKYNLNQEIQYIYNEMKEIRSSTGHTLDQVRSAEIDGRPFKKPNVPSVYLPPIGVRLMKKYVGVDLERRISLFDNNNDEKQITTQLPKFIGKSEANKDPSHARNEQAQSEEKYSQPLNEVMTEASKKKLENKTQLPKAVPSLKDDIQSLSTKILAEDVNKTVSENPIEKPTPSNQDPLFSLTRERHIEISTTVVEVNETDDLDIENDKASSEESDTKDNDEDVFVDTRNNLLARRSSRSTFRTRSSFRQTSRSELLSDHNMEILALTKTKKKKLTLQSGSVAVREQVVNFYLDYGDGKLHDSMEIPKVKDCSRPWCNPHCKSCQDRTTRRPCFILIPADDKVPKRKIPQDKRRLSMFPVYQRADTPASDTDDEVRQEMTYSKNQYHGQSRGQPRTLKEIEITDEPENKTNIVAEVKNVIPREIENILQIRMGQRNKKYSKKRIDELSQPRGGPPAEVRFSKTSLRRKQGEMVELERRKAMTDFEKDNLTLIQGKISVFLAVLNQYELTNKPRQMVDIPIRENVNAYRRQNKTRKRRLRKNVHFNMRSRFAS